MVSGKPGAAAGCTGYRGDPPGALETESTQVGEGIFLGESSDVSRVTSNCVRCQGSFTDLQEVCDRTIAFIIVNSLCIQAIIATFLTFPLAKSRSCLLYTSD